MISSPLSLEQKKLIVNFQSITSLPYESRHFPIIASLSPHDAAPNPKPPHIMRYYPPDQKEKDDFTLKANAASILSPYVTPPPDNATTVSSWKDLVVS
jgi:hypothetical protein